MDRNSTENRKLRAALDVLDFTVLFCSQHLPKDCPEYVRQQIEAAHEAYRHATGEPSFDTLVQAAADERIGNYSNQNYKGESP